MNPIYKILQSMPTNGWTTVIAGVGSIMYGIGGLITGNLQVDIALPLILGGLGALGLGSKLEKSK